MAALVKYAIQIIPRIRIQRRTNRRRVRRPAMPKANNIIRQAMEILVSARPTVVWTLSQIPTRRRMASAVKASSPRGVEVQATIWSVC